MKGKSKKCEYWGCRASNPEYAKYCRACGRPFIEIGINQSEVDKVRLRTRKWKKYTHWKRPITGSILKMIIITILALGVIGGIVFFLVSKIVLDRDSQWIVWVVGVVCFLVTFSIAINRIKKQFPTEDENHDFPDTYDKIERYCYLGIRHSRKKSLYKIFVKNDKMGLIDVTQYYVAIPARYAFMEWKDKQSILTVTLNDDTYDINVREEFV
ncbi:MAG: hypothetical protein LUD48_01310 [Prevotella sp.]|nr:hypothetical protein [Prevotella sp.]